MVTVSVSCTVTRTNRGRSSTTVCAITRVASTSYERSELGRRAAELRLVPWIRARLARAERPLLPRSRAVHDRPADHRRPRRSLVGKRVGAPVLVISQDVFPEIATELDRLRNPAVDRRAPRPRRRVPPARRPRSSPSARRCAQRLEAKGAPPERLRVIPNWVDPDKDHTTRARQPLGRGTWAPGPVRRHALGKRRSRPGPRDARARGGLASRSRIRLAGRDHRLRCPPQGALVELARVTGASRRPVPSVPAARVFSDCCSQAPMFTSSASHPDSPVTSCRVASTAFSRPDAPCSWRPTPRASPRCSSGRSGAAWSSRPARPDLLARGDPRVRRRCATTLDDDGSPRSRVRREGGGPCRRDGAVSGARAGNARRVIARATFWGSLGALAWTHAGYPLADGRRSHASGPRPVRKADRTPTVGARRRRRTTRRR